MSHALGGDNGEIALIGVLFYLVLQHKIGNTRREGYREAGRWALEGGILLSRRIMPLSGDLY